MIENLRILFIDNIFANANGRYYQLIEKTQFFENVFFD